MIYHLLDFTNDNYFAIQLARARKNWNVLFINILFHFKNYKQQQTTNYRQITKVQRLKTESSSKLFNVKFQVDIIYQHKVS